MFSIILKSAMILRNLEPYSLLNDKLNLLSILDMNSVVSYPRPQNYLEFELWSG